VASCVETRHPEDTAEQARLALREGCTDIVAVGGDGTVNEIAGVMAGSGATLGLVPAGSGNGLARHLGIPLEPAAALGLLRPGAGRRLAIDTGRANGHFFINVMGLGFDAQVAARFQQSPGRGLPGYARTAWRVWKEHRPEACRIEVDEEAWSQPVWLLTIANSAQYGNNVRIARGASVADGRLDLLAIAPPGAWELGRLGWRLLRGTLSGDRWVRQCRGTRFRIVRAGPGLIHLDGEARLSGAVVEVAVRPHDVRIWVPAAGGGDEPRRAEAAGN